MKALTDDRQRRFDDWQRSLLWEVKLHRGKPPEEAAALREAVAARQRDLRSAVTSGARATAACLRGVLALGEEPIARVPALPRRLTPNEYRQPPRLLEQEIGESWTEVTVRDASRPLYWLLCHVDWLEKGLLGEDVHAALCAGDHVARARDDRGRLEAETRNLLRRTGGLPAIRGNVSVFSDCPPARAWWRHRFAQRAVREQAGGRLDLAAAHQGLHRSQPVWEELVRLGVRRLTVINHERTRAVLVEALAHCTDWDRSALARAARNIAREAIVRSLDHVSWRELQALVAAGGAE